MNDYIILCDKIAYGPYRAMSKDDLKDKAIEIQNKVMDDKEYYVSSTIYESMRDKV